MPLAFYFAEFVIDLIFFPEQQWWFCFITSAVAALNVTMDFTRSQIFPGMGPTVPIFDWNNLATGQQPYQDALMLVVLNSTVYLIMTVVSTFKTS